MKYRAVVEVETNSIEEEQFVLNRFPSALWIALEKRTKFYIPYHEYNEVKKTVNEWREHNG